MPRSYSEAAHIQLLADKHPTRFVHADDGKMTSAKFEIGNGYSYVRITVIDRDGNYAWSNPIFLK